MKNNNLGLTEKILKSLQSYKELYLTKEFIIPLFKSIGYQKVDDHGGPYEEGKDIICYKENEFAKIEFTVIQVKKYKPTARSSGKKAFSEIVNQLQQASEKKIPHLDGNEYYPTNIYFITPYEIDTRSLQSRFEGYQSLKRNRVTIIDGPEFVSLINKFNQNLIKKIFGEDTVINQIIENSLKNTELLKALNYNSDFDISNLYSDLDFGVGKISTKFFFSIKFNPKIIKIKCNKEEWNNIKSIYQEIKNLFGVSIIQKEIDEIENEYNKKLKEYKNAFDEIKSLSEKRKNFKIEIDKTTDLIENEIIEIEKLYEDNEHRLNKKAKKDYNDFIESLEFFSGEYISNSKTNLSREEIRSREKFLLRNYEKAIKNQDLEIIGIINHKNLIETRHSIQLNILEISNKIKILENSIQEFDYNVEIIGNYLSEKLIEKQKWLHDKIDKFNKSYKLNKEIKSFLIDCTNLFNSFEKIFNNEYIKRSIGITENNKLTNFPRLVIPIQNIFDTRLNLFILGDAGSGKTTTLHVYTKNKLEKSNSSEIHLFLPLARLFSDYEYNQLQNLSEDPNVTFINLAVQYFNKNGLDILKSDFIKSILEKTTTFILDGVDEIIYKFPKIINVINEFPNRYPNTQIIISSRSSGDYVDKINFTSLTLLPFTDNQRNDFIDGWFKNKNIDKSKELITHLNNNIELSDVIRVPLLTTILCMLAENNVPLPNSETRLYEERLRLLLGQYDIHKQAVRIESDRYLLEMVSRKIAFIFHKKGIREENKYEIIKLVLQSLGERYTVEQLTLAVDEIIDPCNILTPMTDDGKFGFGHLRYQEHLAAIELCNNRGIAIYKLLHSSWWRGTLTIFSKLTDDIEFIIEEVLKEIPVSKVYTTISSMVAVRPEKEKKSLTNLIEKHRELDAFDPAYNNYLYDNPGIIPSNY